MSYLRYDITIPKYQATTNKAFGAALLRAEKYAKDSILQGNKSGKKHSRLVNRSSAAGEAPAHQGSAGKDGPRPLVNTIRSQLIAGGTNKVATLSANTPYALTLEEGDTGRNIAARPYLKPAMRRAYSEYKSFDLSREFVGRTGVTKKTLIKGF